MRYPWAAGLCLLLTVAPFRAIADPPVGPVAEQVVSVPVRTGVTEGFFLTEPRARPTAILLLFSGGDGMVGAHAPIASPVMAGNFLVRSRRLFAEHGFVVATLDAPSDQNDGLDEAFRQSETHAQDILAITSWLKERHPLPVWVIGTSRGTLSAANAAIRLGNQIAGLVLTAPVTRATRRGPTSILSMGLSDIRQPTLVVSHVADACIRSPAADAPRVLANIGARDKNYVEISGGGQPRSSACQGLSHHGFIGQEVEVVDTIARFIRAATSP